MHLVNHGPFITSLLLNGEKLREREGEEKEKERERERERVR
jgi:hypothetical protein